MVKTWLKYHVTAWEWNGGTNEYDPVILAIYEESEFAREAFENAVLSADMPQIDLYAVQYSKAGEVSRTLIERKD